MSACDCSCVLWGKGIERRLRGDDPYPLAAHLLDTVVAAGAVWDVWLTPRLRRLLATHLTGSDTPGAADLNLARRLVQFAAGLHDLGKANPVFQGQLGSPFPHRAAQEHLGHLVDRHGLPRPIHQFTSGVDNKDRTVTRHEHVGYRLLTDRMGIRRDPRKTTLERAWFPAAVGGHHGYWYDDDPGRAARDGHDAIFTPDGPWDVAATDTLALIEAAVGLTLDDVPAVTPAAAGMIATLVTGIIVLADWMASHDDIVETGYTLLSDHSVDPTWLDLRHDDITAAVTGRLGGRTISPDQAGRILADRPPRPLQEHTRDHLTRPGLAVLAYPTGEGKTEAALLRHFHVAPDEGFTFALPTVATTDGMHARLAATFTDQQDLIVRSHGQLTDHEDDWFTTANRRMLAPVSAVTCDQVLKGALSAKWIALRLTAIANHHLILDEVHTYDTYQSALLEDILVWSGMTGTSVTILSATLPTRQAEQIITAYTHGQDLTLPPTQYPVVVDVPLAGREVTTATPRLQQPIETLHVNIETVEDVADRPEARTRWVSDVHTDSPTARAAVITNTVDDCINTALLLGDNVITLHARMTREHRATVAQHLDDTVGTHAAHAGPATVVATSVIEASLDLDFDAMLTDLAPAPSLIQRAGRLWRNKDATARHLRHTGDQRTLTILTSPHPRAALPYTTTHLARVHAWLTEHPDLRIPDDVQDFIDTTAYDPDQWAHMATEAPAEVLADLARLQAARANRADLARHLFGTKPSTHSNLVTLTGVNAVHAAEHDLVTRYIDRPTRQVLLLGDGRWDLDCTITALRDGKRSVGEVLAKTFPVTGEGLGRALLSAHAATLSAAGLDAWNPTQKALNGLLPITTVHAAAAGLVYDDTLGAIRSTPATGDTP